MGRRSETRRQDQVDAAKANARNCGRKARERARRDARMVATLKAGSLPYPPVAMSWLSRQLEKPSTKITQDDVKTLLTGH